MKPFERTKIFFSSLFQEIRNFFDPSCGDAGVVLVFYCSDIEHNSYENLVSHINKKIEEGYRIRLIELPPYKESQDIADIG